MITKVCSKCKKEKLILEFTKKSKDKIGHLCKSCFNTYNNKRRKEIRLRNPKKIWWLGLPIPNVIPGYKGCTKCLQIKPINQFSKCKENQDGFHHFCKLCAKKYMEHYTIKIQTPLESKTCKRCGKTKRINEFVKSNSNKDGYRNICKDCMNEYHSINGYGKRKNRKQYLGIGTLLANTIPGYRSCTRCMEIKPIDQFPKTTQKTTGVSSWCLSCMSEVHLQIKEERPDDVKVMWKKAGRKYSQTPKGRISIKRGNHMRKSRAKALQSVANVTVQDIELLLKQQKNNCAICGKPFTESNPYTIDHIFPLSKGGELVIENIQLAHRSCNSSKGDKIDKSKIITHVYLNKLKKESISFPAISECPQP